MYRYRMASLCDTPHLKIARKAVDFANVHLVPHYGHPLHQTLVPRAQVDLDQILDEATAQGAVIDTISIQFPVRHQSLSSACINCDEVVDYWLVTRCAANLPEDSYVFFVYSPRRPRIWAKYVGCCR